MGKLYNMLQNQLKLNMKIRFNNKKKYWYKPGRG